MRGNIVEKESENMNIGDKIEFEIKNISISSKDKKIRVYVENSELFENGASFILRKDKNINAQGEGERYGLV